MAEDLMPRPIRVAVCATHPIQYQVPLWRRLALEAGLEVRVIYGSDMSVRGYRDVGFGTEVKWNVPLTAGYKFEFLSTDLAINQVGFRSPSGRGIMQSLARLDPDVVLLTAYNSAFHLRAMHAARRHGAAIVMRHEASDVAMRRSGLKAAVRDRVLKTIYSKVDRFAAIGMNAEMHLSRLGVSSERIGKSPYCVDSEFFAREVRRLAPKRDELRGQFGIPRDHVALVFCGKLIPKKDPLILPLALKRLPQESLAKLHVLVAGDGVLRENLERELREVLGSRAHLLGFVNQSEIGRIYCTGDYLVLPSRSGEGETWGLVVNEGLQFGLPAIVSDAVGCHPDLVVPGRTGWVFRAMEPAGLAAILQHAVSISSAEKLEMTRAATSHVRCCSLQAAADGLIETLFSAANHGRSIASDRVTSSAPGTGSFSR